LHSWQNLTLHKIDWALDEEEIRYPPVSTLKELRNRVLDGILAKSCPSSTTPSLNYGDSEASETPRKNVFDNVINEPRSRPKKNSEIPSTPRVNGVGECSAKPKKHDDSLLLLNVYRGAYEQEQMSEEEWNELWMKVSVVTMDRVENDEWAPGNNLLTCNLILCLAYCSDNSIYVY
jgi:hypothetical protein